VSYIFLTKQNRKHKSDNHIHIFSWLFIVIKFFVKQLLTIITYLFVFFIIQNSPRDIRGNIIFLKGSFALVYFRHCMKCIGGGGGGGTPLP